MDWISDPNAWVGLLTLTVLELVLGIDNIVFISILSGKLPAHQQQKARFIGLSLAMLMRILLLLCITWVMGLTRPLFTIAGFGVTGRAIILVAGELFLLVESTHEIHDHMEGEDEHRGSARDGVTVRCAGANYSTRHRFLARLSNHCRRHGR